jgi:hypothetical protein
MPIGIQSFEDLRRNNYVYVDKTAYLYKLVSEGKPYFLSRPRRFGKSLFLSTLEAYFLGKKELFKGLAVEKLEEENTSEPWTVYPVLHLDLNGKRYEDTSSLEQILNVNLSNWEKQYNTESKEKSPELRFMQVIRAIHQQTGRQAAVLVDEYDKPLIEVMDNRELFEDYRATLKAFFGVLKSEDEHLKFVFLTGVTKFSQVSIFSDLNQLRDISMEEKYSSLCGITEKELLDNFDPEIQRLAGKSSLTFDETVKKLKRTYDGYYFCENTEGMYNPFSLLNTFEKEKFDYYWFQTGTPTFLVRMIEQSDFDLQNMVHGVEAGQSSFSEYRFDMHTPVPLLYQSGYLTIKGYNKEFGIYTLEFPNEEVKYGFLNFLLPQATAIRQPEGGFYIGKFVTDIRSRNVDSVMTRLQSILASVPYPVYGEPKTVNERTFQAGCFLVFELMGQFTQTEVQSAKGRSDCVVWTKDTVYVFEFKLDGTAEEALKQIDDKGYAVPYKAEKRKVVKIGAGFDRKTCTIDRWLVRTC